MKSEDEFNWVQARYDCSPQEVFKLLESDAKTNVSKRNQLPTDGYAFKVTVSRIGEFSVLREATNHATRWLASSVTFVLNTDSISVQDSKSKEFLRATLTLNKDRECRLAVNGEEFERWYFLCKALERLFFTLEAETD